MDVKLLESMPDEIVASLQVREAWRKSRSGPGDGLEFVISDLLRWQPGSTVRVAFLDGDPQLHRDIVGATAQISDEINLVLDFGLDEAAGTCRRWTEQDTAYSAEIRVSFDQGGYWSLVGTDSNDPTLAPPAGKIGGRPHQRSLNLGWFPTDRPEDWRGTVRHEFLHALGFHHAHQNMRGPCEQEFRWDDDAGYLPTKDARGRFTPDPAGKRPGIYTYLAGFPNFWPRQKVDHNLRTEESPDVIAGPFDGHSVMLYQFEPFFYKTSPSPCAPQGNGIDLSDGDKRGLALLYPRTGEHLSELARRSTDALVRLNSTNESTVAGTASYQDRAVELLKKLAQA